MTVKEARKIVVEYADNTRKVTEEEFFMFTEAMDDIDVKVCVYSTGEVDNAQTVFNDYI